MIRFRILNPLLAVPFLGLALIGSGCVPTTLQLSGNHPATPGAAPGVRTDPGAILRPEAALYAAAAPSAPEAARSQEPDGTREHPYVGRGVVQSVRDGALVVAHEPIPAFMGAMTMAYPVTGEVDLGGLSAGDGVVFRIEFTEGGGYRIFSIEEAGSETGPGAADGHSHAPDSGRPALPAPEGPGA